MFLHSIDSLTRWLAVWFARFGGFLIVVIALMVSGDVLARNLFNKTVFNSFELSIYLFATAVTFGFANTVLTGANIRIDIVYARFPLRMRRVLDFVALISLAALGALLSYYAWRLAFSNGGRGVMSNSALAIPLAIPQALWALGLTVFFLTAALMTLRYTVLILGGETAAADRMASIGNVSDEAGEEVTEASIGQRGP